ncbi:NUDIX domain-containing protein [Luteibacter sp. UNC138MFCol5.1]|uniref:NUDIX domain-containing protein n=1 Tax=Luteibacter sp. UNC138MFCol5.1 TaxID=1502774 RepID=UPI0008B8DDF6|nr:NUDIX domain-containing protein [Luteibacter sp. UNC138MFCol5.1]SEP01281.1 NUDIX domain-containing protein [Luteibacter sp. UNC138MFCol5.1]
MHSHSTEDIEEAVAHLRDTLRIITPWDQQEREDAINVLAWLNSTNDVYRRVSPNIPSRHLVVYAVPVIRHIRHVLLISHRKSGIWLPPGGHVDICEPPYRAAERELHEECGISVSLAGEAAAFCGLAQTLGDIAACHEDASLWYPAFIDHPSEVVLDETEASSAEWFRFERVQGLQTINQVPRFLEKISSLVTKGE